MPNLLRYALGLTPNQSISSGLPVAVLDEDSHLTLTFSRARSDINYVVEVSSDLVNWSSIQVGPGPLNELITVVDDELPTPSRFMRLRVSRP